MLLPDNSEFAQASTTDPQDITIADLLGFLALHREKPLVFAYGGRAIGAGYHVTEVKAGRLASLDCGANPERWTEIFVQLLDLPGQGAHMTAGKFAAIIRKVAEHVDVTQPAQLTFEVSDGARPIALHRAALPFLADGAVMVDLAPRPARCKPHDRGFNVPQETAACCGKTAVTVACCGTGPG